MILCSDKSSERNLSCFFDMRKPGKMEHLQKEEPFPLIRILVRHPKILLFGYGKKWELVILSALAKQQQPP